MAEILEQKQLPNGNIFFRYSYTLNEVNDFCESLALYFVEQLENGYCEEIELPQWEQIDDTQSVSHKLILKEAIASAGLQIIPKDNSHYIVFADKF